MSWVVVGENRWAMDDGSGLRHLCLKVGTTYVELFENRWVSAQVGPAVVPDMDWPLGGPTDVESGLTWKFTHEYAPQDGPTSDAAAWELLQREAALVA